MTEQELRDVVIIGGGAAGLGAGLTLARARRRVTVVDAGQPRNAPARGVHGLLGQEGTPPEEFLARGRAEVAGYGGEIVADEVVRVGGGVDAFEVELRSGSVVGARRLLVATGLIDELPDIPGVAERWGRGVLHCPYCHGWEVRDQRIGVIASSPMSVHQALLFSQWSSRVSFFVGELSLGAEERAKLAAVGVTVVDGVVAALEGEDGQVSAARLTDGRVIELDAAVVASRMVARIGVLAALGITATEHPMGEFVQVDEVGRTTVSGVWAAGNASDLSAQVGAAAADGVRVAAQINAELIMTDAERALAATKVDAGAAG